METLPRLSARQRRGGMHSPCPLRQDSAYVGGRVERVRRVRRVARCIIDVLVEGGGVGWSEGGGGEWRRGGKWCYAAACWHRGGMGCGCVI